MLVPNDYTDRHICVLGCGYVGLTLAVVMADVGFDVTGVEIRDDVLEKLNRGEPHFHEPGIGAHLKRLISLGRLRFAKYIPPQSAATVFIITVGTPLDGQGRARLDMVQSISREVASHLKPGDLVVMRSTVKLGTTRKVVISILDAADTPYDLAFCPERTLEGQALAELRTLPQIVGGVTLAACVRASQLFQFLTPTTVRVSSLETAEMIKLVDNSHRDVFFAFSNEIARLCDVAAIGAAEVIRAGKLGYPRTNLPMPGPVGGPCLSKDPYILAEGFEGTGINASIVLAARRTNENQSGEAVSIIKATTDCMIGFPPNPIVTLLGVAFKGRPSTDDLRGTMALPILAELRKRYPMATFRGWDAVVAADDIARLEIEPMEDLASAMAGANLVVIANNHPAFAEMPVESLADSLARPALIYDFWNNFEARRLTLPGGVGYMGLGGRGVANLPGAVV
ncbi:MAG: nucleotide sugar dehydrogenase [Rhodospirillales bacterium]|nr:nucleotide sugar dehydrogenase [Rhodospirillales bacterium]